MNGKYKIVRVGGKDFYLHRLTWELANGPIPVGHHVHHTDGNRGNNALENLECLSKREHHSRHGQERDMEKMRAARVPTQYECTTCGTLYLTEARHKSANHFCSTGCQNRHYNAIHNSPNQQRLRKQLKKAVKA